jgi:hypothetical protein
MHTDSQWLIWAQMHVHTETLTHLQTDADKYECCHRSSCAHAWLYPHIDAHTEAKIHAHTFILIPGSPQGDHNFSFPSQRATQLLVIHLASFPGIPTPIANLPTQYLDVDSPCPTHKRSVGSYLMTHPWFWNPGTGDKWGHLCLDPRHQGKAGAGDEAAIGLMCSRPLCLFCASRDREALSENCFWRPILWETSTFRKGSSEWTLQWLWSSTECWINCTCLCNKPTCMWQRCVTCL